MKKIEAIIRKSKFVEVKEALHRVEVNFFSYWDVTGVGNEKEGHVYRGITYSTSEIQRRFLSIVVNVALGQIIPCEVHIFHSIKQKLWHPEHVPAGRIKESDLLLSKDCLELCDNTV